MTTYIAADETEFETYAEAASPGDIVLLEAGTHNSISIADLAGTSGSPILLGINTGLDTAYTSHRAGNSSSVIIDGGQGSVIDDLLAEVAVPEATTDANTSCFKISTSSNVIIIGFELKNEGRGVHTDRCDGISVSECIVHRVWDRAIGGYTDNLTVTDCIVWDAALENYENRLLDITGDASGWPAAVVGVYKDTDDTPANNMVVTRVICEGNCWGEAIAPFHCDGATITDCKLIDCSHTVGIYLDQCRGVTITGCFIYATSAAPVRENNDASTRLMHGILLAREGGSFPFTSTGHVIYNNVIVGCETGIRGWNDLEDEFSATVTYNTIVASVDAGFEFEAFAIDPTFTVQYNIIDSLNVDDTAGFTFENNWIINGLTAYATSGNGNFDDPDPTFTNYLNETDPEREDYTVTNMPEGEFYGALLTGEGPADPTIITTTANSTGNTTSLTLTVPNGATAGNKWLIAAVCARQNITECTITAPSGWTLRASVSPPTEGSNGRIDVYTKQSTGSEPANYTWNCNVSTGMCGIMRVVEDIDINNAVVDVQTANGENTDQATGTSVTTEQDNAPVYYIGMVNSSSTDFGNDMSGWGKITEVECDGGAYLSCAMFSKTQVTAGATGSMTSTLTESTKEFALVTMAFGVESTVEENAGTGGPTGGAQQGSSGTVYIDSKEHVRIDLLDHDGNVVGTTDTFTNLSFTIRESDKGDMRFDIPFENELYPLLEEDFILQIWYKWPEKGIGWINIFNGINKTEVRTQAQNGRKTFSGYAPSEEEVLDKAYILYAAGSAKAQKSTTASTAMFEYVRENIGALATIANGRYVAGTNPMLFGADFVVGPTWSGQRAYKNLLDTLKDIRQHSIDQNDQIDFRVTYQSGYEFLFEAGDINTDRTATGVTSSTQGLNGAGNAPVVFAPRYGNLRRMTVSRSRYNEANVVIALGKGEGDSRMKGIASNGISRTISPISQREAVVNASNQDSVSELEAVANARLDKLLARKKVSAIPRDGAQIIWRDFFPGDFVTVEDFDGERYNRQIVEVNVNVKPSDNGLIIDKDIRLSDE